MLSMTPYPYHSKKMRRSRWGRALAVGAVLLGLLTAVVLGLYVQLRELFQPYTPEPPVEPRFAAVWQVPQFSGPVQLESGGPE